MKQIQQAAVTMAALAGMSFFLAGCKKSEKEEEVEVAVQSARAQKTAIARMVTAEGVVFPLVQSAVTPKISAPVRKFYIARGAAVHQGQLLAVLENSDLAAAAMDNRGAFEQADATYKTSVGATLPEDTQKTELEAKTAKTALDAAQKLYDSREELFKQGALPRKDLDQARVALVQAKSQYEQAQKHLESLNALVKQQALRSAGGQLTSAKGKMLGAQAQLSYSEIRSPISGVIADRPLNPGEMASTSVPLLTVMDVSSVIVKAHIPESDAAVLHKGDKAVLSVAGLEDLQGAITVVSPALDPNSTTVEVWVQAKNPRRQVRPGVTAQISITAQTVPDAVVIPKVSLVEVNGTQAQVMVIDAQRHAQKREVKTGIEAGTQVQIVSGIKEGEEIVTEGAYSLPDKAKVKVEAPAKENPEKPSPGEGGKEKEKD